MLGAARVYAEANQATLLTPFILAGAMAPVTAAGVCAQTLAEALGRDDLRPARPAGRAGRPRLVRQLDVDAVGRADVRDAGAGARAVRRWPPWPAGSACRSAPAARCAPRRSPTRRPPTRSAATLQPTILGGVNFVLHAAGWLEGGLTVGYEKFILDADQCGMMAVFVNGVDMSDNGQALDAILEQRAGPALPRQRPHAGQLRDRLLPLGRRRQQQLRAVAGGRLARRGAAGQRASGSGCWPSTRRRRSTPAIDEALLDFIARRKASMPDSEV